MKASNSFENICNFPELSYLFSLILFLSCRELVAKMEQGKEYVIKNTSKFYFGLGMVLLKLMYR